MNGEVGKRRPYFSDSNFYSKVFFFARGNTPANFHLHTEKDTPLSAPPLSTFFFAHTIVRTIFPGRSEGYAHPEITSARRRGDPPRRRFISSAENIRTSVMMGELHTPGSAFA